MTDVAQAKHHRWQDVPLDQLSPTIGRQIITTDRVTLAQFHLAAGAPVATHAHEAEQLTYIVEGCLRLWIGDDESQVVDVRAGASDLAERTRRHGGLGFGGADDPHVGAGTAERHRLLGVDVGHQGDRDG